MLMVGSSVVRNFQDFFRNLFLKQFLATFDNSYRSLKLRLNGRLNYHQKSLLITK
jgi:hypothetical protein